jgi:cell division protein FtsN
MDHGAAVPDRGASAESATGGSNEAAEAGEGEAAAVEPIGTPPEIAPDAAYVVHLGSFRLRREADAEVARLMGLGYDARALHVNVPGKGPWYRVVVGAFPTFEAAHENAVLLGKTTGRTRPNVVGAGGYGAPVPVQEESESSGKTTP